MSNTNPTQNQIDQLKKLLEYTTSKELLKSMQTVFHVYLLYQADQGLDKEFKTVVDNHYTMLDFLTGLHS